MPDAEAAVFLADMSRAPLFAPGAWIQLGIAERPAGPLVGDVGLFLSADGRSAEVGFTLAPAAQGRGIATAAVRESVRLLAAVTTAQRVLGITDHRNGASVRVLERAGFRLHERRDVVFRGEPCTEHVYVRSLLSNDPA